MGVKAWNITKKILRIFLYLTCFIFLFSVVTLLFVHYNKDKVKQIVVAELNMSLKSEITVDKMDLVFIRTFPHISVEFQDILGKEVLPGNQKRDTLFYAKKLYLQCNILDFYKGNYFIKQVRLEKGSFHMKVFKDGSTNYHFWKNSDEKSNLFLYLEKINISDVHFTYQNFAGKQYYDIHIKKSLSSGDFRSGWNQIKTKNDLWVHLFQSNQTVFAKDLPIQLNMVLVHEAAENKISISENQLIANHLPFIIEGSYAYSTDKQEINAQILSNRIALEKLILLLPEQYKKIFSTYSAKGLLDMKITLNGKVDAFHTPSISATFNITEGSLLNKKANIHIRHMNLNGSFTNGKKQIPTTSVLALDKFSAQINKGFIHGKLSISNLEQPSLSGSVETEIYLEDLHKIYPIQGVEYMNGLLKANISLSGKVDDLSKGRAYAIEQCKIDGNAVLSHGAIKLYALTKPLEKVNSRILFSNNLLDIKNLTLAYAETNLQFTGKVQHLLSYLFSENYLRISGKADLDYLNINELFSTNENQTSGSFSLPEKIAADLSLSILKLQSKTLTASNIKCQSTLNNKTLAFNNMQSLAFGGNISGSILTHFDTKGKIAFQGNADIKQVDIGNLFSSFHNFGQNLFTPENLKGEISTNTTFSFLYSFTEGVDLNSIKVVADLTVENGELIQVKPLQKLSLFLDEKSLENIQFKTLKNTLLIQNKIIEIPEMEVLSNAVNFSLHGQQAFDKTLNYHIRLLLSELSSKQQKKRLQKEQDEFGIFEETETGRIALYITIKGTTDNPIFKYDFPSAKKRLNENIKNEQLFLKEELIKEFNTQEELILKENWKTQEKGSYIMEWETDSIPPKTSQKSKKEIQFNIQWEE